MLYQLSYTHHGDRPQAALGHDDSGAARLPALRFHPREAGPGRRPAARGDGLGGQASAASTWAAAACASSEVGPGIGTNTVCR